ncbi:D-glycero-beta-D-manno-heptose 1-phosphate adenylyltransferase [Paenarthrobacter sp. Z7-10]|nr:D-glycero-beta-D-manno-heptose 1-phosphate adenylyltransferase [Paenarthrobacter sp. Z7-10]
MLDGWWSGSIERFCREAPAPVVEIQRRDYAPGGAANTAMNLAAMGARVRLGGLIGADPAGAMLKALLTDAGVDVSGLQEHPGVTTTTKYRVLSDGQILLRMDDSSRDFPNSALESLAASVPGLLRECAALVLCDYGTGALQGAVHAALQSAVRPTAPAQIQPTDLAQVQPAVPTSMQGRTAVAAKSDGSAFPNDPPRRPIIVVDAHDPRPWAALSPDLVTPNARETAGLLGRKLGAGAERADVVTNHRQELLTAAGADAVVVTLDRDGTVLLSADGSTHRTWARPAREKQASGAGDTFVAALTIARACELPLTTSVDLAQSAADVVVHSPGTSVCSTADLTRHLASFADTALQPAELERRIAAERADGRRIVLTNGCFDVLHRGHTRYLTQAKQLGDVLVVALNSDRSVRKLKGPDRPINPESDRAAVIAALSCVDYVTIFDTDTPIPLIAGLRPDIYAKGGDYTAEMLRETQVVQSYGGRVHILDYVAEQSTTAVVQRIRSGSGSRVSLDGANS